MKNQLIAGSLSGHYKLEAVRPDGSRRLLAEFTNLILDGGLERRGTEPTVNLIANCFVGAGSTEPTPGDTSLQSLIGTTTLVVSGSDVSGAQATAPYYGWWRKTYRFNPGAAAGNISEIGVGPPTGALLSRSLVRDGLGAATTITVLPDEYLDVTFEVRLYPRLTDQAFNVTFSGVTYSCVARASEVTSTNWGSRLRIFLDGQFNVTSTALQMTDYQGPLGTVLQTPSGLSTGGGTSSWLAYSANSRKRTGRFTHSFSEGNLTDGIGAVRITSPVGLYQISFSPKIDKTAARTLTLDFDISWARHTP